MKVLAILVSVCGASVIDKACVKWFDGANEFTCSNGVMGEQHTFNEAITFSEPYCIKYKIPFNKIIQLEDLGYGSLSTRVSFEVD